MVISCGLMVRAQCTVRVRVRARDRKWVLFFPALKNYAVVPLVAMWCVTYCGFHPARSRDPAPTPSVGHVTGDMKRH